MLKAICAVACLLLTAQVRPTGTERGRQTESPPPGILDQRRQYGAHPSQGSIDVSELLKGFSGRHPGSTAA